MTIDELLQLFSDQQAWLMLKNELRPGCRLELTGAVGSSFSLIVAEMLRRQGGVHVFVMEDKDAAGYLYNDLYPLIEENRLLFFPTGYKRSIQYGQEDASGLVQRTKALSALQQHEGSGESTYIHRRKEDNRYRWPFSSRKDNACRRASCCNWRGYPPYG